MFPFHPENQRGTVRFGLSGEEMGFLILTGSCDGRGLRKACRRGIIEGGKKHLAQQVKPSLEEEAGSDCLPQQPLHSRNVNHTQSVVYIYNLATLRP